MRRRRAAPVLFLLSCGCSSFFGNDEECETCGDSSASGGATSALTGGAETSSGAAPNGGDFGAGGVATGGSTSTGGTVATGGGVSSGGGGSGGSVPGVGGALPSGGAESGGMPGVGGNSDEPRATFQNPLNEERGSDPWMLYYEGYYYLAATTWGDTLTMKRGQTIAELKAATPEVIWQDANGARCCNMWAPEFHLIDGSNGTRWYHYYTAGDGNDLGTQRSYVLESEGTDPRGPYHFQGQILPYWAIDGSILEHDGSRYFLFSAWDGPTQNIWIQEMTNPWTLTGNRTLLSSPEHAWEQEGSDSVNEGPEPLYHEGRTFLTYSASQCADPGYKLGLLELTGSDPMSSGSWTKSDSPVFQAANGAYGAGHNGFFVSPDGTEHWLVYHATTNSNGSCWIDRTTRIQPFTWSADGTPDFGEPLATSTEILVPSGE